MSIVDFANEVSARPSTARRGAAQSDRPAAKVWLNVGYEKNGQFINLPLGLAIDTMEPRAVRGSSEDFVQLQNAQNALLKRLQEAGDNMEPGEVRTVKLELQLRRVEERTNDGDTGEYSFDLDSIF